VPGESCEAGESGPSRGVHHSPTTNSGPNSIALLIEELKKAPATLRLSYVADVEPEALVERRLDSLKAQISDAWKELDCCYELVIEPEIQWRLGKPAEQPRRVEE